MKKIYIKRIKAFGEGLSPNTSLSKGGSMIVPVMPPWFFSK